ncbi:MAG TPA: hypothetical protein VHW01_08855 [Polyangiaceae bacterium]|nr:hypothetical protein [Polyangiaceae bacterium]
MPRPRFLRNAFPASSNTLSSSWPVLRLAQTNTAPLSLLTSSKAPRLSSRRAPAGVEPDADGVLAVTRVGPLR